MSIFKKLTILFIISFVLMTVIGLWIDNINLKRVDNFAKEKYLKVIDDIFKNIENKNYLDSLILKNSLEKVAHTNGMELKLIFPEKKEFILQEMSSMFFASILLILVVVFLFWHTVHSLFKEKAISEAKEQSK